MAAEQMLELLVDRGGFSLDEAYSLASVAVDLGITQVVDGTVGCHAAVGARSARPLTAPVPSATDQASPMRLSPHEQERLMIHVAADVARDRRDRGLQLNHPEAVAILTDWVLEAAATADGWPT